jgi:hypothetical protein
MRMTAQTTNAHPLANLLPQLDGGAFDELVADIRVNGLLEPITIYEGLVLDGHNRLRACKAAGIEPRFVTFDGDDPLAFVISMNLRRRHLDESQRAMVAARLANLRQGEPATLKPANLPVSQAEAGKRLNVCERLGFPPRRPGNARMVREAGGSGSAYWEAGPNLHADAGERPRIKL